MIWCFEDEHNGGAKIKVADSVSSLHLYTTIIIKLSMREFTHFVATLDIGLEILSSEIKWCDDTLPF